MTGLRKTLLIAASAAALQVLASTASAGEIVTEPENASCGNDAAREAIAKIESSTGDAGYGISNKFGFLGKYQVGEGKLQDLGLAVKDGNYKDNKFQWTALAKSKYGISSNADFLANKAAQEAIYTDINALNERFLGSAMNSVGSTISGCGNTMSKEALLAGAQLGAGKVQAYIANGNRCIPGKSTPTNDKNGTCVEKFMCAVAGCNPIEKDMSKKTCDVTMPMIEAISCEKMPLDLRGFCTAYRPYLMTRAECTDAESWAEGEPKGPNEEQCENLSFGVGTGSWSFVLACSSASDFVADQDGQQNPSGPVSDPACIEKLKGMGIEHRVLGQINNSSNGKTCIIENAVSIPGTAIPFPGWRTMTCDMAIAMEQFGQQMRSLGVTGYTDVQSVSTCRPMRDKNGDKPGTTSEHGLGRAVDIPGFIHGGRAISFGAIHSPLTPDGMLALQAKKIACSTFRGVLSPTYAGYQGAYVHFHVEWGKFQGCR